MARQNISDLQPQASVDSIFRISDRQLRSNRQGNPYLLLQLQDRTGNISAMRWNADERLVERFPKGSFVRVQGLSQLHNGMLQIIVNQLHNVDPKDVDPQDFDALDRARVADLWQELKIGRAHV